MTGSEDERVNQDVGTPREGPRTEAGRALFTDMDPMDMWESDGVTHSDVAAIEDEARSAALDDASNAVVGIGLTGFYRDKVLRAIASLRDKETAK